MQEDISKYSKTSARSGRIALPVSILKEIRRKYQGQNRRKSKKSGINAREKDGKMEETILKRGYIVKMTQKSLQMHLRIVGKKQCRKGKN